MYHHIKFGYKKFSSSEDIIWTDINWNFEPLVSLEVGPNNPMFSLGILPYDDLPWYKIFCKRISSSEDIKKVMFWS